MKRIGWLTLLLACSAALDPIPSRAISLGFDPTAASGGIGDTLSVGIVISGLGDGVAPSVGAFDLTVTYDATLLALSSVSFGALLGSPGTEALTAAVTGAGVVNLAEVSLLDPAALDALQPSDFVMAVLSFSAIGGGGSELVFSQALIGDGIGRALTFEIGRAAVTVGASVTVPEPSAALAFSVGALLCMTRLRALGCRPRSRRG